MLAGENAYYCEKCDKKVDTLKRVCINRLPKTLIIVLKRFEFDFDTMQKGKLNDYLEFPDRLDMEPYTQEGLARVDKEKEHQEKGNENSEEEEQDSKYTRFPKEYYDYKLKGVVIHMGSSDSGHYYSLIEDRESDPEEPKWYEFNDTIVREFE